MQNSLELLYLYTMYIVIIRLNINKLSGNMVITRLL